MDEEIELLARELKQGKELEVGFRQADHVELADSAVAVIALSRIFASTIIRI